MELTAEQKLLKKSQTAPKKEESMNNREKIEKIVTLNASFWSDSLASRLIAHAISAAMFSRHVTTPLGGSLSSLFALFGPSGSGKTCHVNIMDCLIKSLTGTEVYCRRWMSSTELAAHARCAERNYGIIISEYFNYNNNFPRLMDVLFDEGFSSHKSRVISLEEIEQPRISAFISPCFHRKQKTCMKYAIWSCLSLTRSDGPRRALVVGEPDREIQKDIIRQSLDGFFRGVIDEPERRMVWGIGAERRFKSIEQSLAFSPDPFLENAANKILKLACLADILEQWPSDVLTVTKASIEREKRWFLSELEYIRKQKPEVKRR
jgi:energy-coupling factor transporter ATP-binding protein EcfA2